MRRDHRRRNIRATTGRRFCPEQVLVFVIELGCGKLSGHSVRTERSGCSSFSGAEADRSLPLWTDARRDATKMRRRFWCQKIAAQPVESPPGDGRGFPAVWGHIVIDVALRH